jgi:exodeoxyribonuclease-5
MILTKKQEEGLRICIDRYKKREPYTCIAGYAGTGKSTLVKFIVDALDIPKHDVCYVAFTGKASLVLKEKGNENAMTAHRLLYESFPKADGTFYHKPKRPIYPYKLIVVDEISMLPKDLWELLLSHRIHVIALGDPGQLPPIGEDNGILAKPHIFLDEIMRQAQESEIIRLTMDIRAGKPLQLYQGNEVQIIDKKDVVSGMYTWADQIIVAKNDTRIKTNKLMRQYLHGTTDPHPIEGERVICLRNNWDLTNFNGDAIVNGTIGYLKNISYDYNNMWLQPRMTANVVPEGCSDSEKEFYTWYDVNIDYKLLTTGEPTVNKENWKRFPKLLTPNQFDFGYCVTAWKSQGSEYPKVLLFEEDFPYGEDHIRFLYTGATRAQEKLVIVRK